MSQQKPAYAFEEMRPGMRLDLGAMTVSADDIVAFASEFDPQPFHLDEEAGRNSMLGGLSASGWHTTSILMRLLCDGFLLDSTSQGAPGVDFVKWRKPVLAGDRLSGQCTVLDARLSQSRPGIGLVTLHTQLTNQRGETVCELQNTGMLSTRAAAGSS